MTDPDIASPYWDRDKRLSAVTAPLDPLEMLLDAARFIEQDKPRWAKAARTAVAATRAAGRVCKASELREIVARIVVPYWYGGFENQERIEGEENFRPWKNPPGTPNERAYELTDKILAAVDSFRPAQQELCCQGLAPAAECRCEIERNAAGQPPYQRGEPARIQPDPVQDTYLVGGPDLRAMSGSVESDRVIQLHFRRPVSDADRKWLLDAINAKIAADGSAFPSPPRGTPERQP